MNSVYVKGQKLSLRRTRMSSGKSVVLGFDYRTGKQVERNRKEWRSDLRAILADGGERRTYNGETWAVARKGGLQWEAYEILNP